MEHILAKLIDELNSSVFVLLGLLGVAIWGAFKLGGLIQQYCHHEKKMGEIDSLSDAMIEVKTTLKLIYDNTNPRSLSRAQSPVSLTELGRAVAKKIKAEVIFKKYQGVMENWVLEKNPVTAYDVQARAMEIPWEKFSALLTAEELVAIKNEMFQIGGRLEDCWNIFGVLLRDEILKKKGISVAEVDKTDPALK